MRTTARNFRAIFISECRHDSTSGAATRLAPRDTKLRENDYMARRPRFFAD